MFFLVYIAYLENIKHCYTAIGLVYLSNQEKITAKFAEVKSHLRLRKCKKLPQTYRKTSGFAFADHPLLFCGIYACGIEYKFAVPSTAYKTSKMACPQLERALFLIR